MSAWPERDERYEFPGERLSRPRWGRYVNTGVALGAAFLATLVVLRAFIVPPADGSGLRGVLAAASLEYGALALLALGVVPLLAFALGKRSDRLRALAERDPLTDCLTPGSFARRADCEIRRHRRYGNGLCLITLRLDHLGALYEMEGPSMVMGALVAAAQSIATSVREHDVLARVRVDEFAVLLPETFAKDAASLAERVARAIRNATAPWGGHVSASVGIADLNTLPQAEYVDALRAAEAACARAHSIGGGFAAFADSDAARAVPFRLVAPD